MCHSLTVCGTNWDAHHQMPPPVVDEVVPPSGRVAGSALRKGFLLKQGARGWLFPACWRRRFCVLSHDAKLYYYDKENSSGGGEGKSCGVINLEHFDGCEEDPKKPLAFSLDSSLDAFLDSRHHFCAETSQDFTEWMACIRTVILAKRTPKAGTASDLRGNNPEHPLILLGGLKDRVKGPHGRRPPNRKSLMPVSRSEELDGGRQRSVSLSDSTTADGHRRLSRSMEAVESDSPGRGLLARHAALAKELEERLRSSPRHDQVTPCRAQEQDDEEDEDSVEAVLLKVKNTLKELESARIEHQKALSEAQQAKQDFEQLSSRCLQVLQRLEAAAAATDNTIPPNAQES